MKTSTTQTPANTNTNTQTPVKAQPKFSPNYLATVKAKESERNAKQVPAPTQTPIEQAMKIVKATTTKQQPQTPMKTTTTTTIPSEKTETKKPNSRAVAVTEQDTTHFGILVGDICTLVEATNGNVLTAQVIGSHINPQNKRSATKLFVLDAEGKLTTKKIEVYTIRLTKVAKSTPTPSTPTAKVKTAKAKA